MLATARGPTARTASTLRAAGAMPSASSVRRSWRSSSGLPPVASWQAAQNAGSASSPSSARTSAATAAAPSGPGRSGVAAGSWTISASSAGSVPGSPVRSVAADEHGRAVEPPGEVGEEAQRRPVAPVQVVDGEQQRPFRGEVEREPVEAVQGGERRGGLAVARALDREQRRGARRGAGERALPVRRPRRPRRAGARRRSRTRARAPTERAASTRSRPSARSRSPASRPDLPIPAGPSIRTKRPCPPAAAATTSSSAASSASRSRSVTRRLPARWPARGATGCRASGRCWRGGPRRSSASRRGPGRCRDSCRPSPRGRRRASPTR